MSFCRDAFAWDGAMRYAYCALRSVPAFRTMLLRLRSGLAADAFLATLLDLAEPAPEADIADPDDSARMTDTVSLQGHRGRVVGAKSPHKPRGQHSGCDRFQFAAAHLPFRRGDLELLKMIVEHERNLGDTARQTTIHRPGAEFPISQREGVGRGPAGNKQREASDSFALQGKRMSSREHRLASPQGCDPAAAVR